MEKITRPDSMPIRAACPLPRLTVTPRGDRIPTCRWASSFPLLARNDDEAVIAGKGTNLGDTITVRLEGGDVVLDWCGLLLKRE
jgi:hypothetical protein